MTVLGKILVFVNLVFSLVTAALIVMVYTNRVNWKQAYTDQKAAFTVADANVQTVLAEKKAEIDARDARFKTLETERNKFASEIRGLNDQLIKVKADYDQAMIAQTKGTRLTQDQLAELERRKTEVENLKRNVDERDKKIADIDSQMARLRAESIQYKIQWDQSKERVAILQADVEKLGRSVEQYRAQFGGAAPPSAGSTTPAARIEDLRGTIQRVDGDLATITPGSDAGVAVGAKLYVFRLQPKGEFLGYLTILNVTPTQAVGRLTGTMVRQVKVGDEVAATLTK
jgi:hypothetical protein